MAEHGAAGAMELPPTFGELLRRYRTAAGMSQEELAEQAGLSAHGISDLERGARQRPYPDTVQRLVDGLNLEGSERAALMTAARRSGRQVAAAWPRTTSAVLSQPLSSFVGRDQELTRLDSKLLEASAGRGAIVVLTGEPGIGKTCLAEYFADRARHQGATLLWGHCFEGEISMAYAPWTEILRSLVQVAAGPARVRELLGAGAPPIARLVPEIRTLLPDTPAAAALEPDEERFRLHDAVTQLFLRIAQETLVVLVLDDLHWADRDSLRLLRHVARFVTRGRLLVVGTYREVEVSRQHPLTETLAMLRREVNYTTVPVRGWSFDETAAYLAIEAGEDLPQAFVQRIQEEAEGSPFYTREVFRHLVEDETIVKREGRWSTDRDLADVGIPEGVRQVVGSTFVPPFGADEHAITPSISVHRWI
jgi:transcriptional regulator with XRE-family HTH domain